MSKQVENMQRIIDEGREPLVIEINPDNRRVIAEVFDHPKGILFVDVGFCDIQLTAMPYHVVEGELSDRLPYKIGSARINVIDDTDPLFFDWYEWKQWKKGNDRCTREEAYQRAKEQGLGLR